MNKQLKEIKNKIENVSNKFKIIFKKYFKNKLKIISFQQMTLFFQLLDF